MSRASADQDPSRNEDIAPGGTIRVRAFNDKQAFEIQGLPVIGAAAVGRSFDSKFVLEQAANFASKVVTTDLALSGEGSVFGAKLDDGPRFNSKMDIRKPLTFGGKAIEPG